MDFSYLKRPSNEQIGVWGVTTLFTAWIVNRRPELFLNPSTNWLGISLASVINGAVLTLFHNALRVYFRPIEQEDPQLERLSIASKKCDDTSRERVLAHAEHQKAQMTFNVLGKDKGAQIQKQQGRVSELFLKRKEVSIQLAAAQQQNEIFKQDHLIKAREVHELEQDLLRRKEIISQREETMTTIALQLDASKQLVVDIQKELESTLRQFRQYEKEVPNLADREEQTLKTLKEMSERLEKYLHVEQTKRNEYTILSSELQQLEESAKTLVDPIFQTEEKLKLHNAEVQLILKKLKPILLQLSKLEPNTPNLPETIQSCAELTLWIEHTLQKEKEAYTQSNTQLTEVTESLTVLSRKKGEAEEAYREKVSKTYDPSVLHRLQSDKRSAEEEKASLEKNYDGFLDKLQTKIQKRREKYEDAKKKHESKLVTVTIDDINAGNFDHNFYGNIKESTTLVTRSTEYRHKISHEKLVLTPEQILMYLSHKLIKAQKTFENRKDSIHFTKIEQAQARIGSCEQDIIKRKALEEEVTTLKRQIECLVAEISEKGNILRDLYRDVEAHRSIIELLNTISQDSLGKLKELYKAIQAFEAQKQKQIPEQSSISLRKIEVLRLIKRLEMELQTFDTPRLQKTYDQETEKYKTIVEALTKARIFLTTAEERKSELGLKKIEATQKMKTVEIQLSLCSDEIKRLEEEYIKKAEFYKNELSESNTLALQTTEARERVEKLEQEYTDLDSQYTAAKDTLTELNSRLGVNFSSAKQSADNSREDWKRLAQDYSKALHEQTELEYSLRESKQLLKEVTILQHSIRALEAQKTYYLEKSKNLDNVFLVSHRHEALEIQRKYLEMQIQQCRAQYILARSKREYEEFRRVNPPDIQKAYKEEQMHYYQLELYLEKLFQHNTIIQWEEQTDPSAHERLQIQIQDSITRQADLQRKLSVIDYLGFEIIDTSSPRLQFKLGHRDIGRVQDDLVIKSLIASIEICLMNPGVNLFHAIAKLLESPPEYVDLEIEGQHSLRSLSERATKTLQELDDKKREVFALIQAKIEETFEDEEQRQLLIALEECRLKLEPFESVIQLIKSPPDYLDLETDNDDKKKSCLQAILQEIEKGRSTIVAQTTRDYQELQKQVRELFGHKSELRFLLAKLDLLQHTQQQFSAIENQASVTKICKAKIEIADIIQQKKAIKIEEIKKVLANKEQKVGNLPKQEISASDKAIEAIVFISPEILLLLLYKMQVIGKLLEKVGANITWSSAWKTCIWTFAIHSKSSYLLERDPRA
ncbi:MAG: hypothetical protein AB7H48_09150 [Parachlamydiales bacterium]|nr:hypothetical protein [Halobacteriovoraceae bacterium]